LNNPKLKVNCTCIRVPVYRSHSESITIEFKDRIDAENLAKAVEMGEEFLEKDKKVEISFDGSEIVITKIISYAITEEFVEENEKKLKKLGILK